MSNQQKALFGAIGDLVGGALAVIGIGNSVTILTVTAAVISALSIAVALNVSNS